MAELRHISHWIFDMDGTLTVAIHDFNAMRRQLELPGDTPILEALAALPSAEQAWRRQRLDEIELELAAQSVAAPGAGALLESIAGAGKRLGILTRNNRPNVEVTLRAAGLWHFFSAETIVSRDDAEPKPSPAGIQLLLNQWTAGAESCAMVGDYVFDLRAGRAAGVAAVYVDATGKFPYGDEAHFSFGSLAELQQAL